MSVKFQLGGSIYDTDVIASIEQLLRPLTDRNGGSPITHVMNFKSEYIRHESMRKGKFLTEEQALEIGVACLKPVEVVVHEIQEKRSFPMRKSGVRKRSTSVDRSKQKTGQEVLRQQVPDAGVGPESSANVADLSW